MHLSGLDNCGETKRSDFESVVYLFRLVFLVPHLPLSRTIIWRLEASSPVNSCSHKLFQTILSDSQVHPHSGPLVYTRCHSSIYSVPLTLRHPKESISPYSHLQHTPVTL